MADDETDGPDEVTGLSFTEITPDNWREFTRLQAAPEGQKAGVASNLTMLARAYAYREQGGRARGLCLNGQPIGLMVQRDWEKDGRSICILDQLMIAYELQDKGYGSAVMKRWLSELKDAGRHDAVELCYLEGHDNTRRFYERHGFSHTGEVWEDEIGMALALR